MITIYSKTGCPYCIKLIKVVEYEELPHVVYQLDRDYTKEEFYEKFGEGSTFPQIIMDGNKLGGCTDTVKYLRENKII